MSNAERPVQFFVGWDVGGWNCDNNRTSRDALVILDAERNIVGKPWRGNLRTTINEAKTTRDWLVMLFEHCHVDYPINNTQVVLAIDTPLGFSEAFIRLVTRLDCAGFVAHSYTNPYLFRATEQFLFENGLKPLSPIKDMIGSQATKGVHVLAKFAPKIARCGVWTDGSILTAIEAYPSACKRSAFIQERLQAYVMHERINPPSRTYDAGVEHQDHIDALICALIGHAYEHELGQLVQPLDGIPESEGWIWVPKDGFKILSMRQ